MTHQTAYAELPAFVIGALDADDAAPVAEHLTSCPICAHERERLEQIFDVLGTFAPPVTPPDELRARVLSQISDQPTSEVHPRSRVTRPVWVRFGFAAAAAAILLLTAASLLLYRELAESRDALSATEIALTAEIELLAEPARAVPLIADDAPNAYGTLYISAQARRALLVAEGLPPTPSGRVYQIWLVHGAGRDNGGVFTVDQDGTARVMITAPGDLSGYQAMGITTEPAPSGSPGPTGPRVVGCRLD